MVSAGVDRPIIGCGIDQSGFTFAFQPIIDTQTRKVHAHEALIRGINNESAYAVLGLSLIHI